MDIIFVCTGNSCRSPMAEGIFRALDGEKRLNLQAGSAGLFACEGMEASPNAVKAAGELGADIAAHRARQLTAELVERAQYLVCMTAAHYDHLVQDFPQAADKTYLLMNRDVADPFGGSLERYRACAAQLKEGIEALIAGLERQK